MNNLIKIEPVTKKIILDCLMKIKLDHQIIITEKELREKINLLFEDCKDLPAEIFIKNCEILRKREMFGKFPINYAFISPDNKPAQSSLCYAINKLIGQELIKDFIEKDDCVEVEFKSAFAFDNWLKVDEEIKNSVRNQLSEKFNKPLTIKF
jgi:hypothetical protein